MQERNGQLEVDIIQARGLTAKPGSKTLPGLRPTLPCRVGVDIREDILMGSEGLLRDGNIIIPISQMGKRHLEK